MAQRLQPAATRIPARSGFIDFLLTSRGLQILRASQVPMAKALLKLAGQPETDTPVLPETGPIPQGTATEKASTPAGPGCGTATGTRFNLEPRTPPGALPQNETSIDFLPGAGLAGADLVVGGANDFRGRFSQLGNSVTGYYVHRNAADTNPCSRRAPLSSWLTLHRRRFLRHRNFPCARCHPEQHHRMPRRHPHPGSIAELLESTE